MLLGTQFAPFGGDICNECGIADDLPFVGTGEGGGLDEPGRQWSCRACGQADVWVVGIAALVEGQLRFWLDGYCAQHEQQVRDALQAEARGDHPPEIMVKRSLRPADVRAWMQLVRREAGVT